MQPAPNAFLAQEKALAFDTLSTAPSSPRNAIAANLAGNRRATALERTIVFIFAFLFLVVKVAERADCPPARDTQMIQLTAENKYRFNMQVSARAMGCRDCSLSALVEAGTRWIFAVFER